MTKPILLVFADRDSHLHWMTKRVMKRTGFELEQFEIDYADSPQLDLSLQKCKVAVAMGQVALQALIGEYQPFRWMAKQVRHPSGCWVIGAMDPLRLLPNRSFDEDEEDLKEEVTRSPARFTGAVGLALKKAFKLVENPQLFSVETRYVYNPSPEWFKEYVDDILATQYEFLSWDIETPYARKDDDLLLAEQPKIVEDHAVIRISFCHTPGYAISIPWDYGYLPHIRRLFANFTGYNVGWNSLDFDVPYLLEKSYTFGGAILDGMDAWRWLYSDLDKGLEHVTGYFSDILPWKHLSKSEPAHYSCIDADAALRNTIAIVQQIKDLGAWDAYKMASLDLMHSILYPAGRRGVKINVEKQTKLKTDLRAKLLSNLEDIQNIVPDKFKRYKQFTRPRQTGTWTEVNGVKEQRFCTKCDKINVSVSHPCVKAGEGKVEKRIVQGQFWIESKWQEGKIVEWLKDNGFNPNSSDQLRAYIRAHGHPLGQNHKNKNPDEAVDAKHLKKLAKKYGEKFPVYGKTLEIHKISKALSTYCYEYDENELIHTTFTNKPSTWRLASENVNLHNVGKREDNPYAREARRTIEPLPGYVFLQGDSSSIEAVLVGHFMNNSEYIKLAKQSIHAFLVCKWNKWEWNEENLQRAKKDPLYDMMKRTVHGCLTGDHEVLTQHGWVRFDEYNFSDPIAQWHEDGTLTFCVPKDYVAKPIDEDVLSLEGANISTICTMDHRWPVITSQGNVKEYHARDLPKANSMPSTGCLLGGKAVPLTHIKRVVATQADGSCYGNTTRFHVSNPVKIEALQSLGATYLGRGDKENSHRYRWETPSYGLTPAKTFNLLEILSWDNESRLLFLAELPMWDGDKKNIYRTSIKSVAKDVQTIAHVTGLRAKLSYRKPSPTAFGNKGCWEVRLTGEKKATNISLECLTRTVSPYRGMIYCVTTKTGYFLVRRNDKVFVTGNTNYGMGYRLMHTQYPELFKTASEARMCQDFLFAVLPELAEWQHQIRVRAQKECYLESPWKHRHYFYDVFSYKMTPHGKLMYGPDGKPLIRLGADGKRAVAYLPQHSGGMFMRENLGIVGRSEWKTNLGANCNVHDSLCLMVRPHELERAKQFLIDVLTRPIAQLGGLRIGCEIEVGENWLDMQKVATVKV